MAQQIQCPNCGGFKTKNVSKLSAIAASIAIVIAIVIGVATHWIVGVITAIVGFYFIGKNIKSAYECEVCGKKWTE